MASAPTKTHCPYCSLQCGITLDVSGDRIRLEPQSDFPTNRGGLCAKGWTAAELLGHPERLTRPLVRDGRSGELRPAGWNEALERVVSAFERTQREHGRDAVGCFGGGGLTNEKAYQFGKFARVALRTSAIDYNGRFCMSSAAAATNRTFGIDRGLPFPLSDIAGADVILLVGSNPADTMPPAMQYFDEGRSRGAKHIVVDPRRTATAARADIHLQPVPGTDLALANGLLNVIAREGLLDQRYIDERTAGFEAVRRAVRLYWPDRVERITGVPERDIVAAARMLGGGTGKARRAMILTARGAEQHSTGTDTAQAFINLALALGLPGRPYSGFATITGQGNGQGGREHGQKADQLPGYRRLDDPDARAHVARVWGVNPADLPSSGRSAYEMLSAIGTPGGVRALWVVASNVVVSAPNSLHVADKLSELDFLVVSDIFLSETAAMADVVLPTTQWAEESGTMTNLEGRVILRQAAVSPPDEVRSDLDVMADLAKRLGAHGFSSEPQEVFDELGRASQGGKADYRGISYERIATDKGVFWPCPSAMYPDTPRMFAEDFPTPDRRAHFHPVEQRRTAELPDDEFPYYLTTGRLLRQYQSGTQTRRVAQLTEGEAEPVAELHPTLAQRMGIGSGDKVRLKTRRGEVVMTARLNGGIRPDTVFAPFHWGGAANINRLTNPVLDPYSRMPSFKVCAVAVSNAASDAEPNTDQEGDFTHG
ncbi:molybdopterin oxidoreductase family protein [Mycobacterium parmense]|uniref:Molybdopterin oxidoreductase n=1 Tax=Mycobacterium parmense TaxID=185642 RepID=A0A7I7YWP5_9MYCO|nr:molybdopterin oxidoreductase family protein [Mycobacterium parmense]MCV7353519.1 molybdopterin oxidoreductase family protein [Mycobacterium parmense]ORW50935.1 nitrite reductase [Mycobacterium parmense]BBZ46298.1 molybdopterin oxidoreductase [Mycobacterium parmense]